MDEQDNIIKIGPNTVILNGGNPLEGCPKDWDQARKWEESANENNAGDCPKWSFDCGFKLDFDGPIITVLSRFYPPKTHYGPTWDGNVTIYFLDKEIEKKSFDCATLDDLKKEVEVYVNSFKERVLKNL